MLKKIALLLSLPILLFSVDQTVTISVVPQSSISFRNLNITNSNFKTNSNGSLSALVNNTWSYFNNEKNLKKTYKITGQITSHSSKTAPLGWSITSFLGFPSDGTPFGVTYGNSKLPWSDEVAANFIRALPQTRAGSGTQTVGVFVNSIDQFTTNQSFTISWTISVE